MYLSILPTTSRTFVDCPPKNPLTSHLQCVRIDALDALLNNVVPVLVFDTLQHVPVQLSHYLLLLLGGYWLERLLYHPTSVHLQRERQDVAPDLLRQSRLLFRRAELKELLNDIVAKNVRHEGVRGREDLIENHLFFGSSCSFQFLLDESGAVLVLGEFDDVVRQVSKLEVGETVVSEVLEQSWTSLWMWKLQA